MRSETFAADPILADFALLTRPGAAALVRRGYEGDAGILGLDGAHASTEEIAGGRARHPLVTLERGDRAVVRRYWRGGAVRHLNRERYFLGHRSFEELRATERARGAGARVPEVLAAIERRAGIGYTATLATRWIPDSTELAAWLESDVARDAARHEATMREAGRQIGILHAGGVGHPDLNLRNFLVAPAGADNPGVYILDFDRARVYPGPVPRGRRARDLRRLARSAHKLRAAVDAAGWQALRQGYGGDWPLDSALG